MARRSQLSECPREHPQLAGAPLGHETREMSTRCTGFRWLVTLCATLALPPPTAASTALNCFGSATDKTSVQVHAILDCALEDGSYGWCDFAVKIQDQWIKLPTTLRSTTRPRDFPEAPEDLVGAKTLKPPVTVLRVLDGKTPVLVLILDKITVTDAGPIFIGRTTLSWKGHRLKDLAVTCEEPG